ncbi:uncharacterized protein MELLADRAFT_106314 [Melampsora larici-populina 98AG31]|uniref:Uncharacterized protein n=1 Tax=Melampsora larici-populina (strain 98AG31 / pathotype 3-4-7) TaxID=747676 RepID=F4RKZ3_MELLP|nr:uncharacterized protein MELLADRAFT_106314 [Melampsora larici-populina 98AG31]EGG06809.1 hypothetical protein MELLADRAFT_106314 [Melampsora larici-populina 98AG31]
MYTVRYLLLTKASLPDLSTQIKRRSDKNPTEVISFLGLNSNSLSPLIIKVIYKLPGFESSSYSPKYLAPILKSEWPKSKEMFENRTWYFFVPFSIDGNRYSVNQLYSMAAKNDIEIEHELARGE